MTATAGPSYAGGVYPAADHAPPQIRHRRRRPPPPGRPGPEHDEHRDATAPVIVGAFPRREHTVETHHFALSAPVEIKPMPRDRAVVAVVRVDLTVTTNYGDDGATCSTVTHKGKVWGSEVEEYDDHLGQRVRRLKPERDWVISSELAAELLAMLTIDD